MAYLRLYYSNWYAFCSNIEKNRKKYAKDMLEIWYPYHENALSITYEQSLSITPDNIREHFKIPIPDSDIKELFNAIHRFQECTLRDAGLSNKRILMPKKLRERRDMDSWDDSRWVEEHICVFVKNLKTNILSTNTLIG